MSNTATAERATADAMPPVLMERLSGGRGIVRVGDTVTPKVKGDLWDSYDVKAVSSVGLDLKAPDGAPAFGAVGDFLLTSRSELQARAQLESIREMVAALKAAQASTEASAEHQENQAREAIEQDPLSVEVRSGWVDPSSTGGVGEFGKATEFKILLCTGGPAVQIRGELDENGDPEKPRLQHQDWGTPWTDYRLTSEEEDVLTQYCRCFCFES